MANPNQEALKAQSQYQNRYVYNAPVQSKTVQRQPVQKPVATTKPISTTVAKPQSTPNQVKTVAPSKTGQASSPTNKPQQQASKPVQTTKPVQKTTKPVQTQKPAQAIKPSQTVKTTTPKPTQQTIPETQQPAVATPNQTAPQQTTSKPSSNNQLPVIDITNDTLNSLTPTNSTPNNTTPSNTSVATAKTLSWTVPTKRIDGTSFYLRELGGYFLVVKNVSTGGVSQIHISNPDVTTYALRNFRTGKYAFSIQSYDIEGLVSPYSPWVNVTF